MSSEVPHEDGRQGFRKKSSSIFSRSSIRKSSSLMESKILFGRRNSIMKGYTASQIKKINKENKFHCFSMKSDDWEDGIADYFPACMSLHT